MKQYGMVIDLEKCIGCHACAIACKAEWEVPAEEGRNWLKRLGPANTPHGLASTYYPGLCNHCDHPPCVDICPADTVERTFKDPATGKQKTMEVAATWKDPFDGTVQIDKAPSVWSGWRLAWSRPVSRPVWPRPGSSVTSMIPNRRWRNMSRRAPSKWNQMR